MDKKTISSILIAFGLDVATPISLLRESSDNYVFTVEATDKKVLRISKRLPINDAAFECDAINYLARNGAPVPKFINTLSGKSYAVADGLVAVMTDFIEGRHAIVDKDHLPTKQQAHEAGKGLAKIHTAAKDFDPTLPRQRTIFTEFERALSLEEIFVNQFDGGAIFIDQVKESVAFAKSHHGPISLIHNDYRPGNVFLDTNERLVGIIDFDWSCMGPAIKDTALGVLEWSFPDGAVAPDLKLFDDFLEGYNSTAIQKQERNRDLYEWIAFAALSDAATYFCDLIAENPGEKRAIASYMYRKYKFFKKFEV